MAAIGWIAAVALFYVALWRGLAVAQIAIRFRLLSALATLFAGCALSLVVAQFVAEQPYRQLLLDVGLLATVYAAYWVARARMARVGIRLWRRPFGKALRSAGLHLALASGAAVFSVPFAWLIVTSFKEDIDMSKFPPVWVPKRQIERQIGDQRYPISIVHVDGRPAEAAVLENLESGEQRLRILPPDPNAGEEIVRLRSEITPIRKVGLRWENYRDALRFLPEEAEKGWAFLRNTLVLAVLNIIGIVLSSSMVAFGFARLRFPGRDAMFALMMATMMLPGAVTMLPVFLIFRSLGWVDTLNPLWVPAFFASAFSVFLFRQFMMTIPLELEEAAKLDGCTPFGIYWRVALPLIKPAMAAITIMTFLGAWNNFMGPLIYINSPEKMPVAYALQLFQTDHGGEPGMLMAACTMVMSPVVALFFFTQRYFIQGVTLTGLKG
ncbi:MAG: carbohydrate ABC transporter permease [Armatimonadetes bacterium]|nr:carbohydrate ABC transporter permease [Armatimonadota bacterium]